ncbi:preprotein translocase subunit SecE [Thiopseudomonas acetoxidans]|jgi:preprotein translocase subunit SecE|uniref:Protein translocase subunit SecE n=1 Tax=Thiopseudomonas acetoxidans TaxID=3041622 RepID=A0ABT7SQN8_9GAMM|nr:preprotein translocase subunit SecE [Thiopseudomonas sp. CY1220]MDM7858502.1 preprotein translocase subunit SecE [Thiopseudomonas sp. CY1220]NLC09215.1 preprotein translocase subunit SecE [Gammaproteobacteria bacterium]
MNAKADSNASPLDSLKWIIVVALIVIGVVANQYYASESILYRAIGLLVLGAVALFIAAQTAKGRSLLVLAKESRAEIRKVVWPSRPETVQTTLIVVVVVLIMGLLLWGLDTFLGWIVSLIVG